MLNKTLKLFQNNYISHLILVLTVFCFRYSRGIALEV